MGLRDFRAQQTHAGHFSEKGRGTLTHGHEAGRGAAGAAGDTATCINLGWVHIGAAGATTLAGALATNPALTVLHLWGNVIGDTGATALAGALATNVTMTQLWLDRAYKSPSLLERNKRFLAISPRLLFLLCASKRRELILPPEIWHSVAMESLLRMFALD